MSTHILLKVIIPGISSNERISFYDNMQERKWFRHESVETVWSKLEERTDVYSDLLKNVVNDVNCCIQIAQISTFNAIVQIGNNTPIEFEL